MSKFILVFLMLFSSFALAQTEAPEMMELQFVDEDLVQLVPVGCQVEAALGGSGAGCPTITDPMAVREMDRLLAAEAAGARNPNGWARLREQLRYLFGLNSKPKGV